MLTKPNRNLTPAQNEALDRAWGLLCEHFDVCVLGINTEIDRSINAGELATYKNFMWHGGDMPALGLAHWVTSALAREPR